MTDRLFNTPFEMSLHILLLLDAIKAEVTIERITAYDFIALYAQYFGFNIEPLNGENIFAFSEVTAKRKLMKTAAKRLILDGLVVAKDGANGINYTLSESGRKISRSFQSEYAMKYQKVIKHVHRRYKNKSDIGLASIINRQSVRLLRR